MELREHYIDLIRRAEVKTLNNSSRKTKIIVNKKNLPAYYDDNDFERYQKVVDELRLMQTKGFITLEYNKDSQLKSICLNDDQMERFIEFLGVKSSLVIRQDVINKIELYKGSDTKFDQFLTNVQEDVKTANESKRLIDIYDSEFYLPFYTVNEILKLNREVTYRKFSIELFNDSKKFEKLKSKISTILNDLNDSELAEDEILKVFNVVKNPTYVFIKGNGVIHKGTENIQLDTFKHGLAISNYDLNDTDIFEVSHILTIENLTTYNEYTPTNELVIYTGGFTNSAQNKFINQIVRMNNIQCFNHWGDIDLGGILILMNLNDKIDFTIEPYMMDEDTLKKYEHYLKPISKTTQQRIEKVLTDSKYLRFHGVLEKILQLNGTLEQEAIELK